MTSSPTPADVTYRHSDVESRRFGRPVGRIEVAHSAQPDAALSEVLDLLAISDDDVVILRYPTEHVTWSAALRRAGRDLVHADVLTTWRLNLARAVPEPPAGWPPEGTAVLPAAEVPRAHLERLVVEVFDQFSNHYAANPLFDASDVVAGYVEWVVRSVEMEHAFCVVAPEGPVGFVTFATQGRRAVIHLGGFVARARLTRGPVGLFAHVAQVATAAGCRSAVLPTQAHNQPMQRLLVGSGYVPTSSTSTVHAVRRGLLDRVPVAR